MPNGFAVKPDAPKSQVSFSRTLPHDCHTNRRTSPSRVPRTGRRRRVGSLHDALLFSLRFSSSSTGESAHCSLSASSHLQPACRRSAILSSPLRHWRTNGFLYTNNPRRVHSKQGSTRLDLMEEPREEERAREAEAAEAAEGLQFQDYGSGIPFARGGPIFVSGLVGPRTSVPDFKASVLDVLQSLQAELVCTGDFEQELDVDELKVLTEEELVEEALKESSEWQNVLTGEDSLCEQENSNDGIVDHSVSRSEIVCLTNSAAESKKLEKKKSKKRGRRFDRDCRAADLQGSFMAKVDELAKIKQRQDEDKLAARLHSFSGNCKLTGGATSDSEKLKRMKSLRFITCPLKVKSLNSQEHVPIYFPEIVLCVEVYDAKYKSRKNQEFLVLGSQTLTELKDRIYCLTDKLMDAAGQSDPSGYFLIEDTFYNDLRNPSSIDYSEPIFDWLKNNNRDAVEKWDYIMSSEINKRQKELLGGAKVSSLPTFKAMDMHKTRFYDLRFRLGSGYLYCHQGNCMHNIVIRDMRLIHPEDAHNRVEYPRLNFQLQPRYRKCSVCKIYIATKMTVDDKWAAKNPSYFCINCYFLLHYKEDNSLLYPHTVFDYFHE